MVRPERLGGLQVEDDLDHRRLPCGQSHQVMAENQAAMLGLN
jgi:hypothetical protein